ncbi:solute carrier family 35 member C2-like [Teleopsis dalmanni]|uniref:solute carrier family 35 member C2-like n=1 Tax=Teleopsis dalmanni TaxID=139649 RepID=UPI0018CFE674|nr:solute carrier family 35 member C2-like [Teleopsis dalmanni]
MSGTRYERLNDDVSLGGYIGGDESDEIELESDHRIKYHGSTDIIERNGRKRERTHGRNIVHEQSGAEQNIAHLPRSPLVQLALGSLCTVVLYLILSICLIFYQKALVQNIKFPLTIVSYHLVIKFILSAIVRAVYKCRTGKTRVQIDFRTSLRNMAPTGIASGIDIGFSNWGLELVTISLYTMTKSSTIVFILIFAIILGLEKKSWVLVFIVALIATGLFMLTYKSTQFNALGFIFILGASLSSGIRWSFAQFLMQKSKLGLHNPIDMIYYMQPWMMMSVLPLIAFEGPKLYDALLSLPEIPNDVIYMTIIKITFGAMLAFLMEVSEFLVVAQTSSLTLSIAGIFKDFCQLALAFEFNGDQLSLINVLGLVVCLAGICCHLLHKYTMLVKLEAINSIHNDNDLTFLDTTINNNGVNTSHHNQTFNTAHRAHTNLTVPLLDETDSDDSNNGHKEQNSSDVIFDVLKRRDMQR